MSADAASLPCPICFHTSVFNSAESLRDRLIYVSTNKIPCPICQKEICGLDKLTIHLFSHVKIVSKNQTTEKSGLDLVAKGIVKTDDNATIHNEKPRLVAKNKSSSSTASAPMKYVKIYPKLPIISLNSVPIINMSQKTKEELIQTNETVFVKTESSNAHTNTTCSICELQFVDSNILRMHRCLIHNIDDNVDQSFTRYNCHLCPKNFKMRGSLMVHLRVAHFGFLSGIKTSESSSKIQKEVKNPEEFQEKILNFDRNDSGKQWQCDVCRKYFTTKYFLKKHKRLHTGETPYACTQCNKTFTFQQSYHKHLLYHNDLKPHTCSFCGRAFKELSTLHNHQRIHTGEKPFACETCGKCFRQRVSYLVHRRIHTGVMPYKCTACEKNFRYKVSQRTHKCQAQPPGTVVRQSGDLVEKLKKRHVDAETIAITEKEATQENLFPEVSEANAELVRTGAKLSLEDMESENFRIISEPFIDNVESYLISAMPRFDEDTMCHDKDDRIFDTSIDDLINNIPIQDKNVPSPSEILKNLCLSKESDFTLM